MAEDLRSLILTGKLPLGTTLYHQARRYSDRNVEAKVVREGLQVGHASYSSPSAAARAVTGRPVDGWAFWRLPDGRRLDALRASTRRRLV